MFDPILVPLDGSSLAEGVLPHVVSIAQPFEAKVILLRVLGQNQAIESGSSFDPLNWQIKKAEAKFDLDRVAAQLQALKITTQSDVSEGSPADSINEFAQAHGVNLIILSSQGNSGLSEWGISSTVQKIMLSAPTSILIVRAQQQTISELKEYRYQRILVPLDGSWRAEYVLPMVATLARYHKSQVHIVHVVTRPEMARHMPPSPEDIELSNRLVERNQEEGMRYLEQLKARAPLEDIEVQTHLLVGDNAIVTLHQFVERESIDIVVFNAHGYSGVEQWPYGSMVNNFVLYSKVPLLVVQDVSTRQEPAAADVAVRGRISH